jgi:signal peptide peptidase SppA
MTQQTNKVPDLNLSEFCKGQFWPIYPPSFEDMYRRLSAESANGLSQHATLMPKTSPADRGYTISDDGTAIISISGPLTKRMGLTSFLFGGTSYIEIKNAFKTALSDDEVNSILLRIDSPGGVVNGLDDTVDMIFENRGRKRVVAYADGMMASAAYAIGSAADEVLAGPSAMVGSIGVLMVHEDWSKWNERVGIDVTYLTAGRYKALGNPDEPLSDLAKETFKAELNYLYSIFVDTVARNRDVEASTVLSDMADGRIFIGQQAVDAGLVDGVGNFDATLDYMDGKIIPDNYQLIINQGANNMAKEKENKITLETLIDDAPDLVESIEKEAAEIAAKTAYTDGVNAERERVMEILGADADAEETRKAIEAGTAAADAYKQFYTAERSKRAEGLRVLQQQATDPVEVTEPEMEPEKEEKTPAQQRVEWRPLSGPVAAT